MEANVVANKLVGQPNYRKNITGLLAASLGALPSKINTIQIIWGIGLFGTRRCSAADCIESLLALKVLSAVAKSNEILVLAKTTGKLGVWLLTTTAY
ncbi:hypothetical protein EVAR_71875_1 [Eumeta japonica]|uniref:Uncharacterized protein n=1 Tax=Eumeta variegata TaxID=151549 RepID=A0A4C1T045_EUMVA|nr:hypothetical protein EVAR_71875_1 [Eumeta japonica]